MRGIWTALFGMLAGTFMCGAAVSVYVPESCGIAAALFAAEARMHCVGDTITRDCAEAARLARAYAVACAAADAARAARAARAAGAELSPPQRPPHHAAPGAAAAVVDAAVAATAAAAAVAAAARVQPRFGALIATLALAYTLAYQMTGRPSFYTRGTVNRGSANPTLGTPGPASIAAPPCTPGTGARAHAA